MLIHGTTVCLGATKEGYVPVLERTSGLTHNGDLFIGYSPGRITPVDKQHPLTTITKVKSLDLGIGGLCRCALSLDCHGRHT